MLKRINIKSFYFYFLYFPRPIQYLLRLVIAGSVKNSYSYILLFTSFLWTICSAYWGDGELRYVLGDFYIDIGILYWISNSGRNELPGTFRMASNLFFLYMCFFMYMELYNLEYIIRDWRGDRLLSFYNGAAGIVLMSFALNFFLFKRNILLSIVFICLLAASQSRMALVAPFITLFMGFFTKICPGIMKAISVFLVAFCMSSFLWLPLTGLNGTGRFYIWLNMFDQREFIFWYGEVFDRLKLVSKTEDQLHNLYLHLWLSRSYVVFVGIGLFLVFKLNRLIDSSRTYAYSTLLLFLFQSITDNVVLYPFLLPFVL